MVAKAIFMEDSESNLCYLSLCYSSLLFWNQQSSSIYFKDIRSLMCSWSFLVLLFLIKSAILIFMLALGDSELEIWTWKIRHCSGDPQINIYTNWKQKKNDWWGKTVQRPASFHIRGSLLRLSKKEGLDLKPLLLGLDANSWSGCQRDRKHKPWIKVIVGNWQQCCEHGHFSRPFCSQPPLHLWVGKVPPFPLQEGFWAFHQPSSLHTNPFSTGGSWHICQDVAFVQKKKKTSSAKVINN